jgi:hypothetical protein
LWKALKKKALTGFGGAAWKCALLTSSSIDNKGFNLHNRQQPLLAREEMRIL